MPASTVTPRATAAGTIAGCGLTTIGVALLNRASAGFEVAGGVTLVFPASAATVLAALLLGWWGVGAAFLGFLVAPWGLATTLAKAAYFAGAASLQGAIPAAMRLRPEGPTWRRALRLALFAVVVNTLASAALGTPMVSRLAGLDRSEMLLAFTSWFLSDLTAVVLLAVPAVLLLRPELLLEPLHERVLRAWMLRWRWHLLHGLFVIAWLVAAGLLSAGGVVSIHWLAPLLLVPVFVNAVQGALGGGLIANGVVGAAYVGLTLQVAQPGGQLALFRELYSSYANLAAFTAAAAVAGLYSTRSASLVAELEEHRRLLQESFERVVTALAAAIEAKDRSTEGHVQRVAWRSVAVGDRLGLRGRQLELLRYAAILHDVGKIGVSEEVLNKPGPLDDDERAEVERHVEIGVAIVSQVDILRPAIPFIRYHQERWDGRTSGRFRGYTGLKGEAIPLEARIIAVVDAYDAMTSARPYSPAVSHEEAVAELRREAGRQFDPRVVEALIEVIGTGDVAAAPERWPVLGQVVPDWLEG